MFSSTKRQIALSFNFSGRTSRSDYLRFLALSIFVFSAFCWLAFAVFSWPVSGVMLCFLIAAFYFPVTASGVRRLHDVGQSGTLMLDPLKPAVALAIAAFFVWLAVTGTVIGGFVGLVGAMFFSGILAAISSVLALAALFMTLAFFSNTMGLLLLPSQPGPNKYGPNPNEVPS